MTRWVITLFALLCALALGAPAAVAATSSNTAPAAISDCYNHGKLTAHYSPDTLRSALAQMPVDVREYSDCYDVIERQLFATLGQTKPSDVSGSPASSSGSGLPTWLLVVIVLLALAGVTFGALAIRRRFAVAEGPDASPRSPAQPPDADEGPRGPDPGPGGPGGGAGA